MLVEQKKGHSLLDLLICGDDPGFRSLLEQSAGAWGYRPIFAPDEPRAWEIMQRSAGPRLLILDWEQHLQAGLDLSRKIKRTPGLPYIYVLHLLHTSRNNRHDILRGLDAGADEILVKPVVPEELQKRLLVGRRVIETLPPPYSPADLIVPGYTIGVPLRSGGLGSVYRALRLATGQQVALKVIRMDRVNARAVARFAREIELTSRMHHPNIVRILDARMDIGLYYYAMELIHGPDLTDYINQQNPGRLQLLQIMSQVCAGVAHAHAHGIVHRDLKFANVLINENHEAKLVDFGLGKALLEPDWETQISSYGLIVGTPAFMSPEQATYGPEKVGPPSDVYALGVMLYRLMLGHHPHELKYPVKAMLKRIVEEDIRPPRELAPNIHPLLEAILLKALAKDPAARYPHAGAMGEALGFLIDSVLASYPHQGMGALRTKDAV